MDWEWFADVACAVAFGLLLGITMGYMLAADDPFYDRQVVAEVSDD